MARAINNETPFHVLIERLIAQDEEAEIEYQSTLADSCSDELRTRTKLLKKARQEFKDAAQTWEGADPVSFAKFFSHCSNASKLTTSEVRFLHIVSWHPTPEFMTKVLEKVTKYACEVAYFSKELCHFEQRCEHCSYPYQRTRKFLCLGRHKDDEIYAACASQRPFGQEYYRHQNGAEAYLPQHEGIKRLQWIICTLQTREVWRQHATVLLYWPATPWKNCIQFKLLLWLRSAQEDLLNRKPATGGRYKEIFEEATAGVASLYNDIKRYEEVKEENEENKTITYEDILPILKERTDYDKLLNRKSEALAGRQFPISEEECVESLFSSPLFGSRHVERNDDIDGIPFDTDEEPNFDALGALQAPESPTNREREEDTDSDYQYMDYLVEDESEGGHRPSLPNAPQDSYSGTTSPSRITVNSEELEQPMSANFQALISAFGHRYDQNTLRMWLETHDGDLQQTMRSIEHLQSLSD